MDQHNLDKNAESSLRSARYKLARDAAEEPVPVDEYAQKTGRSFGDGQPSTEVHRFHADEEVWEVANSAIDAAVARGDFDNLALAGKPIPGLGTTTDPDWWVKGLIERENISGLGPPALLLRKEDQELETTLDRLPHPAAVRDALEDFNARVIEARRQLLGGPPVITALRDIEAETTAWHERRGAIEPALVTGQHDVSAPVRTGWLRALFTSRHRN